MNPFETETMADLCLRQGHRHEALAIYRRLLARTPDPAAHERMSRRISVIERGATVSQSVAAAPRSDGAQPVPMANPGVRAAWSDDQLTVEWRLPAEIQHPALEVLLVKTGPAGVLTETRAIDVEGHAGLLTMGARDLHSARVAAGSRGLRGFIPMAVAPIAVAPTAVALIAVAASLTHP